MSKATAGSLFLGVTLFLASCLTQSTAPESGPILIGLYADLSSTGARDGNDALKGAQMRVREANATGGVGGRMVELRYLDMKQNPTEAVKAFTRLAEEEGVCAVIGSTVLNAGLAVSPVADLMKVPLVSLSVDDRVTTPEMKGESAESVGLLRQNAFLTQPTASLLASSMAAYAIEHFLLRRFATLYDPSNMVSVIQARAFENVVRKAGRVITVAQELPQGAADQIAALARIRDASTEALYICGTTEENLAAVLQAHEMGFRPVFLGNQEWSAPFLEQAGDAADDSWFSIGISPDDPALAELQSRFVAEYGEPPRPAMIPGWDAVGIVLAAVRKAGSTAPQRVRDALERTTGFKGLTGQIEMDRKTHRPVALPVAIMRIAAGACQTVESRYVPKQP